MDFFFHDFSPFQIAILSLSAILVGINKTGMPGIGILPVVLMANAFETGLSTGLQLVLLATADIPAVVCYRKTVNWKIIFRLLPMALSGMLAGVITLLYIEKSALKPMIAIIIIALCLFSVIKDIIWRDSTSVPKGSLFAAFFGFLGGFTTLVANAAGPVMAIYLIAMRFSKKTEYMGTSAVFFFIVNWIKLPIFCLQERITSESFCADLAVLPFLLLGAWLGVRLLKIVPQKIFEKLILILSAIAAVKMLF